MVWDCPKCGLVNPPEARFCDCGYDKVAGRVDRERAPKRSGDPGLYDTTRRLFQGFGSFVCSLVGIFLLLSELSEQQPSAAGIIRAILIVVFGFSLIGVLIWFHVKSR